MLDAGRVRTVARLGEGMIDAEAVRACVRLEQEWKNGFVP